MSANFSFHDRDVVTVSDAMRRVVSSAYRQKGTSVPIPHDVLKDSCSQLSEVTAEEILAVRRQERAVSAKTLAFSFS